MINGTNMIRIYKNIKYLYSYINSISVVLGFSNIIKMGKGDLKDHSPGLFIKRFSGNKCWNSYNNVNK